MKKLIRTKGEVYWEEHGGAEWEHIVGKRVTQSHYVNQLLLIDKVFSGLDLLDKRVLEVGCGFGRILNYLDINFGIMADGLDQSKSMIDTAKNSGIDSKRLFNVNIRKLPKNIKRYEIVYTCEALVHVHPYLLLGVLETILNKAKGIVVHIETSPTDVLYQDDCHKGFWKHDYIAAYELLGKEVDIVFQEGTRHSAYIIRK